MPPNEDPPRCAWWKCHRPIPDIPTSTGRPRLYCKRSCRQRAYEANLRTRELGLTEAELIVARTDLETIRDRLHELQAAIDDTHRDLSDLPDQPDWARTLRWLLDAAEHATSDLPSP